MSDKWTRTTLGALVKEGSADYQTGPFGTVLKASEYSTEGSPLISVGEIRQGHLQIHPHTPRVNQETKDRLPNYVLEKDDIVFGRKGAIDRNAIIQENQAGYFLGSDGIRLRLSNKHDSRYFSYYLRSPAIGKWLISNGQGAVMPSLNQKILDRLPVTLPKKDEQFLIGKVLSQLDEKIELNNRINEELESLAKLIYNYWFVQFDFPITTAQAAAMGDPTLEGKPYKSTGGPMTHNPQLNREIPEGWSDELLSILGEVVGGSTPASQNDANFTKEGIPWLTPKDLSNSKGQKFISRGSRDVTEEGKRNASLRILPRGTVLLTSRAPVGYTAIASGPMTTNQGFKSFIPNEGFGSEFIYRTLNHFMPLIEQNASGSTFKEISGSTLQAIRIPIPTRESLTAFTEKVEPMSQIRENLEKQNQELAALRDWLLPMLMNGQVTVRS